MQLWHSVWQMLKKCHTTIAEKPVSMWEMHQSWDQLTSAGVIQITSEAYNSDRQFDIMQSLSATSTSTTVVQNPSVSKLHMVQMKHNRKELSTEDGSQGTSKPCYCCEATPSHPKKECLIRNAECYKCRKEGHFKGSCRLKKEKKVARMRRCEEKAEANESP